MSILDQSRALSHIQGIPPVSQTLVTAHTPEGPPNPEVLLALLARNKALEGKTFYFITYHKYALKRIIINELIWLFLSYYFLPVKNKI